MRTEKNKQILFEQTNILFSSLPISLIASTFNACVLVYILREIVSESILIAWLVFVLSSMLIRGVLYIFYHLEKPWDRTDGRWHTWNIIGVLMSSIAWGSSNILIFPESSVVHQAFLAFVIAGMSAGAVSTLAHSRVAVFIFITSLLPLLAIRFFIEGSEFGYAMGAMITLYYFVLFSAAHNIYKSTRQNIELRIDTEFQKKELKESKEKYFRIFDSSPLGIMHYHKDGTIESCNNILCKLLDITSDELKKINLLTLDVDFNLNNAICYSLKGNATQYEGSTASISPNTNTPIRVYFGEIRDLNGEISGGVAIVEDKTEDKRVEKLKSEFVSTVSHELRTPLTAINGSIRLIKNAREKITDEEFLLLLANVERNSDRLLDLVNDILDMEKLSAGKVSFTIEKLPLFESLSLAVIDNQPYADQFNVRYRLSDIQESDKNIFVNIDKHRFLQVLTNLLSNAAKFSQADSEVLIGIKVMGAIVRISITDDGDGIADDFKAKIFDKFTQQDSTDTRRVGGTGLGLAISKELIERMNGTIHFESKIKQGTTFYIDLPIA